MQPSWRFALNTLSGKPGRTALMIAAVALAAALVVAMSCAIGSVQKSMELGITRLLGAADVRIIHSGNGRFDERWLETVRTWPQVKLATGRLVGALTLVRADGKRDVETNRPLRATPTAIGIELLLEPQFRPVDLLRGTLPQASDEILIDPMTAKQLQADVGDLLHVQRFGEPIALKVVGVYERPMLGALQRPLIQLDHRTLAEATNHAGQLTSISIQLQEGQDAAAFCARHADELPPELTIEPTENVRAGFDRQVRASRFGFTIASVLTFTCASFIIVTALTTSVTQRQREMAVARCIGASRGQLFGSQVIVGLLMAGGGAAAGVPLGIGLTAALVWWYGDLLPAGLHIHPLGIQLALLGSLGAGLLGAIYPAWMASRVSPLAAMTFQARPPRLASVIWCAAIGGLFIAVQLALLLPADASTRFFAYAYAGLPAALIGYFLLAIPLLLIVAPLVSWPLSALLRLPPGMLRRSVLATPFRHGFTAGALMVGIAILVSTWSSMTSLMDNWIGKIKFADAFAYRVTGITPREQEAIANLPFVEDSCPISLFPIRVIGRHVFGIEGLAPPFVTAWGFDPDSFFSMNAVEWVAGDPQRAIERLKQGDGVIVADRFLTTQKVVIGDQLTLGAGRVRKDFEIVGAVNSAGLDIATQAFGIRNQYMDYSISSVFMNHQTLRESFGVHDVVGMQLSIREGTSDEEAIERVSQAAPGVQYMSGRWILETINEVAIALLTVQSAVAFAALTLACLGMANVIIANIHGRRFEYGVLRAIGAQRGLLARLILGEATILALTGALAGTLLGLHLAWNGARHYRDLAGIPVQFVVPEWVTLIGWLVLLGMTLIAALPAVLAVIRPQPSTLLAAGRNG